MIKKYLTYIKEEAHFVKFEMGDILYFVGDDEHEAGLCVIRDVARLTLNQYWIKMISDGRFVWAYEDDLIESEIEEEIKGNIRWYHKGKLENDIND